MFVNGYEPPLRNRRKRHKPWPGQRNQPWAIFYKAEMLLGHQFCRLCLEYKWHASQTGRQDGLQWGHILSDYRGGMFTVENITIVCGTCNTIMGNDDWTGKIEPLSTEWERIKMTVDLDAARAIIKNSTDRVTQKENPQMSFNQIIDELKNEIHQLAGIVGIVLDELETARINAAKPSRKRDELTPEMITVLEFFKQYPGLAFAIGSVSANMDDMSYDQVNSAVGGLYRRDLIKRRAAPSSPKKSGNNRSGAFNYYYEKSDDNNG